MNREISIGELLELLNVNQKKELSYHMLSKSSGNWCEFKINNYEVVKKCNDIYINQEDDVLDTRCKVKIGEDIKRIITHVLDKLYIRISYKDEMIELSII